MKEIALLYGVALMSCPPARQHHYILWAGTSANKAKMNYIKLWT